MKFNNPSTNKIIGYLILFASFIPIAIGYKLISSGKLMIIGVIALLIGIFLFCASVVWMFKKVRCPHCNALLPLKIRPISKCPYCGKRTDDI